MIHNVLVPNKNFKGLNPIQFGYENCEKSHFFGPAVRTYWLIHYVVSGFGVFECKGNRHLLSPGDMFIIAPGEETYYEADSKNPWSYIWIGFTGNEEFLFYLPPVIRCPDAGQIFGDMKKCGESMEGRSAYLLARLWDLFAVISGRDTKNDDYIKKAVDYIHSEYMNSISVQKIADILSLERTYFSVLFKNKTGVSPKEYILNHRMNIAASLILENSVPVSVVATSVGYSDIFTFSKMFKKHFGVSPKNYKNKTSIQQNGLVKNR